MKQEIQSLTQKYSSYVTACYRHIHAHPELSFEEFETSLFIQNELTEMQIPFRAGIGGTGILGRIEGKNPKKKAIALRADMDALPVCEAVELPWKSKNENVMHACGHDAHTACLLGAAKILSGMKEKFEGTILLIFSPVKKKLPEEPV